MKRIEIERTAKHALVFFLCAIQSSAFTDYPNTCFSVIHHFCPKDHRFLEWIIILCVDLWTVATW